MCHDNCEENLAPAFVALLGLVAGTASGAVLGGHDGWRAVTLAQKDRVRVNLLGGRKTAGLNVSLGF
jgi:hypothetical protein